MSRPLFEGSRSSREEMRESDEMSLEFSVSSWLYRSVSWARNEDTSDFDSSPSSSP